MLSDCKNPNLEQFQVAAYLLKKNPAIDLNISIVTDPSLDKRRYNQPTVKEIAIILPDSSVPVSRKDIVFEKSGGLKNVDVNHASYDGLQYPLMNCTGALGYQYEFYEVHPEKSNLFIYNILSIFLLQINLCSN